MPEKTIQKVPRIEHERVLRAFRALGFTEDVYRGSVVVLRQTDFPFRRITLPDSPSISSELIRLYLTDLGIDVGAFYRLIEENQG
jgi:predicted RNA binding protein YcfA (HicA-like mRNA interferase family)